MVTTRLAAIADRHGLGGQAAPSFSTSLWCAGPPLKGCAILAVWPFIPGVVRAVSVGAWLSLVRAPGSGPGGRWFKSTRPDHYFPSRFITLRCVLLHDGKL